MLDSLRIPVLRLLKVPPEPRVPVGDEIRVFRAAPNFFRYRLVGWALTQAGVLAGVLFGALIFSADGFPFFGDWPWYLVVGVFIAWVGYIVQLPLSLAAVWLDWDQRWYIVSDRSLRIREGVVGVKEKTMTFANIQQISIRENPLQRLLGIADVRVRTAGGGDAGSENSGGIGESMHEAYFRGVDNAEEIRATIRERVRLHRGAGLGDPEDALLDTATASAGSGFADLPSGDEAVLAAVGEVRDELIRLRAARVEAQGPTV